MLSCHKCLPGMRMVKPCTREEFTQCVTCDYGTYTPSWNNLDSCMSCSLPCKADEVEAAPCTSRQNRVCECKPGYYKELFYCITHFPCPPGTGVVKPGNPREDTQCGVCPEGSFSSNRSAKETCQAHQNCAAQGLLINVPGTLFHDAYCTACRVDKGSEKGSGTGDCVEAALDFVAFQLKSPQRLQRLYRQLAQSAPETEEKKKRVEELQVELHSYLVQLKNLTGKKRAWNMVQEALTKMKLQNILQNVQRRFSVS
ncbi:tumor necrosis factor receptor superfamily member 6B-like [Ahaetulla prasina]|uniref:tumor necrosis factor receptor superfamily member 6B-like n=1 Tax=Ahaetulla prasina TaxID=499056 RepID=UPI0026473F9B|nr:tumor necrosis factor receptor superfamily member 6B-like [Ahaetulla prasina]